MIPEYDCALHEFRCWIKNTTVGSKITAASSSSKWLGLFLGLMILNAVITTTYAEPDPTKPAIVVFVCLHGSVKSQMAAAHFNRIAKERGLPAIAVSRGIAVDKEIPFSIREGLAGDGLVPTNDVPIGLTSEEVGAAANIFAFDEVPAGVKGQAEVTYWSDVPPATKDYVGARSAIVRHLEEVVSSMRSNH
jgi:protein-tyrosine-phosphatase